MKAKPVIGRLRRRVRCFKCYFAPEQRKSRRIKLSNLVTRRNKREHSKRLLFIIRRPFIS